MSRFKAYLERQCPPCVIEHISENDLGSTLFVTIPCFDEPGLLTALDSLAQCSPPSSAVTVIVVINSSDKSTYEAVAQNERTIREVLEWWNNSPRPFFQLRVLHAPALPSKWAGVGWARKLAMDEAIRILDRSEREEGILVAFDADSRVSDNYFTEIESAFRRNPSYNFVNLNFCHPVDDPALSDSLREGIILYELYLRYLRNAIAWCGYIHSIHTVGSSFAVRASSYVKQGGMNRRQAGEDFHFLHKIILLGDYGHVHGATVYPAARISHRVPFGTGAALKRWEEGDHELHTAYSLKTFETLCPLFSDPGYFFDKDPSLWESRFLQYDKQLYDYLKQLDLKNRLTGLRDNCADRKNLVRRFYHEVNAFRIIQYLNLCEAGEEGKGDLVVEASRLLEKLGMEGEGKNARELLEIYRNIDVKSA